MHKLRICTYNIHKGFSQFNRRMVIHELRDRLRVLDPDVVFLQEVQGMHLRHARRHADWPTEPQYEFLASTRWQAAYGGNAAYGHGHHGNAVLSRYRIVASNNHDVTQHRLERRGLLHCELELPNVRTSIHCICVHLSLTEQQRVRQLAALADHIENGIPSHAPLIIAGDFNDWRNRAADWAVERLGLREAFTTHVGMPARSFPSNLPMLRLDRIYLRGFDVARAEVHWGRPWSGISDHAALTAEIRLS
ncbi:endonuclease/exonuclease/phosphatase family protein [Uliginosibacterium sp. sgz301328]|uniref:endonuclease/exonuclease/phosphatase family protein n=1 Tax=Uliginosibacterium sp. sgz301328 TaxID=3243764 RepID=UPI00359D0C93